MKRIVILLLVLCCSLLSVATLAYAAAAKSNPSVSSTATQKLSQSFGHLAMDAVHSLPADNGTDYRSPAGIDQEDEDDLLRKNSLLPKYVLAIIYSFLSYNDDGGLANAFPFYQHQARANDPLYIRLGVFRI